MEKENELLEKQLDDDDLLDFDLDDLTEIEMDDESPEDDDDIIELVDLVEEGEKAVESPEEEIAALLEEEPVTGDEEKTMILEDDERPDLSDLSDEFGSGLDLSLSDEAGSELDLSLSDFDMGEESNISEDMVDLQADEESLGIEVTEEEVVDKDLEDLLIEEEPEELADGDLEAAMEPGPGSEEPVEILAEEGLEGLEELDGITGDNESPGLAVEELEAASETDLGETPVEGVEELEALLSAKEISEEPAAEDFQEAGAAGVDTGDTAEDLDGLEELLGDEELPAESADEEFEAVAETWNSAEEPMETAPVEEAVEPGEIPGEEDLSEEPVAEDFLSDLETMEESVEPLLSSEEGADELERLEPIVQESAPFGQGSPDGGVISAEKIEAIVRNVVEEVVERVARETMSTLAEKVARETMAAVAESVIGQAIEALKQSLETSSD